MSDYRDARNESVSLTTTSATVAERRMPNDLRKFFILTNTSTAGQILYYVLGEKAATTSNQPLNPGDTLNLTADAYAPCWQGAIQVLSSAINATAAITED